MYVPDYDQKKAMRDFRTIAGLSRRALKPEDAAEYALARERLALLTSLELLDLVLASAASGIGPPR